MATTTPENAPKGNKKPRVHKATNKQIEQMTKVMGESAMLEVPKDVPVVTEEQRQGERRANVDSMAFAVQQLSTPITPEPPKQPEAPDLAKQQFAEELAKLQEKYGVTVVPPVRNTPKNDRLRSHDVTRPGANTTTGKIWQAADEITASQNGVVAAVASVKAHKLVHGINDHTVKTQYARWRKYNGVTGRLPTLQPMIVKMVEGQDDGLIPMQ